LLEKPVETKPAKSQRRKPKKAEPEKPHETKEFEVTVLPSATLERKIIVTAENSKQGKELALYTVKNEVLEPDKVRDKVKAIAAI